MAETRNDYTGKEDRSSQQPQASCPKSFTPWIWTLLLLAMLTLGWAVYESYKGGGFVSKFINTDDYKHSFDKDVSDKHVPGFSSTVALPDTRAVVTVQESYHGIIEAVRPALISIDVAVAADAGLQAAPDVAGVSPNLVAGAPVANYNRVGSGVVIDPIGFVLTSFHVIEGATAMKATVYTAGGAREYPLKVVNVDKSTDLALLRIIGNAPFAHAVLGDSDVVRTGDVVVAMGSPFGFDQTITTGIISSRNRTITIGGKVYEGMLQTDTPINRGNSGGPLVNVRGEVIGINTAIYSPNGAFSGIGFAIPANDAATVVAGVVDFGNTPVQVATGQLAAWQRTGRQVGNSYKLPNGQMVIPPHPYRGKCLDCHPQLCQTPGQGGGTGQGKGLGQGQVAAPNSATAIAVNPTAAQNAGQSDPFFGAVVMDVDSVVAKNFNLAHQGGVLIDRVYPGTPAEIAGLSRGDIILRVDGRRVGNVSEFKQIISAKPAGNKFELVLNSNGAHKVIKLKTAPMPPFMPQNVQAAQVREFEWLGSEITPLTPAIEGFVRTGVYVADTGGVLAAGGVMRGDVIKAVNNQTVTDIGSFMKISKKANVTDGILLDIVRQGQPMYLTIKG
ncbi:MAG: trypsin-like peptidase domain-containing protein [Nitrospirae bacterium]|nr:trypsin-like peptidase domain-containing protein [Nitrospirota bacterium]